MTALPELRSPVSSVRPRSRAAASSALFKTRASAASRTSRVLPLALFIVALAVLGLHLLALADAAYLWTDELFSWSIAVQPSWPEMWRAMYRGSDGMFPAFYTFSWLWARAAGSSELALRLPPILFTLAGAAAVFRLASARWGRAAACAALSVVLLANHTLVLHACQFRGYGMLLGFSALGLCLLTGMPVAGSERKKWLCANACVQFILWLTHPFGVLYSAALGVGKVVANVVQPETRRWDWGLFWSYLPAFAGLIAWLPGMRQLAKINIPRGWIPVPALNDLAADFLPQLDRPWGWIAVLIGLLVLGFSAALFPLKNAAAPQPAPSRNTAIILSGAMLAVTPLAWIISQIAEPLLIARYLIPTAWAWAVLGAAAWSGLARTAPKSSQFAALLATVGLAIFGLVKSHFPSPSERAGGIWPVLERLRVDRVIETGLADDLVMPEKLPILMEGLHNFLAREHYNPRKRDYRLVINEQTARDGTDIKGANVETKLVLKLCENGLPAGKVLDVPAAAEFVERLPAFYFIDVFERPTADEFLRDLKRRGWKEEVIRETLPHRVAGLATVKKFTAPAAPREPRL